MVGAMGHDPALAQPSVRPPYIFLCEHLHYDDDHQAYLAMPRESVERYLLRGEGYQRRGQYARAAEEFRKGLKLGPDDARLWFHLGGSYFAPRKHKEAIASYRKALRLKPGMYMARGYLALSLGYLGNAKESRAELAAAPRVAPTSAQQWSYDSSLHFFRRNYKAAIDTASRGVRAFPEDGPYLARGRAYLVTGRYKDAIVDFSSQVKFHPADAWAYSYRAECYEKLGRKAEAAADRREFARLGKETLK